MLKLPKRNGRQEMALTVTNGTFFRVLALIIGSIIVLGMLRKASHALLLIFIAFFLALALNAPVHWLAVRIPGKKKGSRPIAITFSFLVVVIAITLFFASLVPPLIRQTENFIDTIPKIVSDVKDENKGVGKLVKRYNLQGTIDDFSKQLSEKAKHAGGAAVSTISSLTTSVVSMITVLVLTFMMLVEGPRWAEFARELLPEHRRNHAERVANDMYAVIKGYVNGQVILALIASLMMGLGLFVLGISYPVALMVIVFIAGLIPMVGHTIGIIIVSLVALFNSPTTALLIFAYYIFYQQIENYLIQPRVQANTTNMSPLLVFMAVVVGVSFGGIFGGLVAIPIAGCIRVLLLDYLHSRRLIGDPVIKEEIKEAKAGTK